MLRAAAVVEKLGIPAASIISSAFLKQAEVVKRGLGVPLAIGVYPGVPLLDSAEDLARKVEESLAPGLLAGLTVGAAAEAAVETTDEHRAGAVVFRGSLQQVQDYFYQQMWTDGLPVIPPTRERIDEFLAFTDRKPDEVICAIPQEGREASILSIAINGVLAGCRPEYMPVLIAVIEAMADPVFRIEDCGSTPGWEPVVIVSGAIAKELDFNCGQGMMRFGRQANTSVGRFVRIYLRNVCGFRIPPGAGDKGSIGQSFLVAMAEDEDAAREIGWPTYGQDRGFGAGESAVTVRSVINFTGPMYSAGTHAVDHVQLWAELMTQSFMYWAYTAFKTGEWYPLVVAGPGVAKVVASEWSKQEVRQYLYDHMKMTAERATHYARVASTPTFTFEHYVKEGLIPASYTASDDPERLVNIVIRPEMIDIVIGGDPGRNQSRAYLCNHIQGAPVSRAVKLPSNWKKLRGQSAR